MRPMTAFGTFRTWRDVRLESAFGGIAEVGLRGRQAISKMDPFAITRPPCESDLR
jgi:hypothetical protein